MGKGSTEEPASSQELARIASDLYSSTDPLRQNLIGRSMSFLGIDPSTVMQSQPSPQSPIEREIIGYTPLGPHREGGDPIYADAAPQTPQPLLNPSFTPSGPIGIEASPLFAAMKQATEDQYGRAKDNILASVPAGGALTSGLVDLETGRARDMVDNLGNLYQQEIDRAMSFALGTPVQTMQGLGQAANVQSNMALANSQQNAGTKQALGMGAGAYFGGKAA